MKKSNKIHAKAYLKNIARLQEYIRQNDFSDGGWLPSGRKMARIMGTSHLTYCKALKFLENEGLVQAYPNRGHYVVPECVRCEKIGLILCGGEYVPFLSKNFQKSQEGYSSDISAIIDVLAEARYDVQLIQMPTPEQAFAIAEAYAIKGLIWYSPPEKLFEPIRKFQKKGSLPFVVAIPFDVVPQRGMPEMVCFDFGSGLCRRVEHMIKRGHRKLLFLGEYVSIKKSGALDIIKKAGMRLTAKDCYERSFFKIPHLPEVILSNGYTGIIANGGTSTIKFLFDAIVKIPDNSKPEVIMYSEGQYNMIKDTAPVVFSGYPEEKIIYVKSDSKVNTGVLAARKLLSLLCP